MMETPTHSPLSECPAQYLLNSGQAVSPCTDSYVLCPAHGVTYPLTPVPAGAACWQGLLVLATDPHCTPCAAGSLVTPCTSTPQLAQVGVADVVPAAISGSTGGNSGSASAGLSSTLLGAVIGGAVAAVLLVAAGVAASTALRARKPSASLPPALCTDTDLTHGTADSVAVPPSEAPLFELNV